MAYKKLCTDNSSYQKTSDFTNHIVYGSGNVTEYVHELQKDIRSMTNVAANYRDWIHIAEKKSELDVYCAEYGIDVNAEFAHAPFLQFICNEFGKMSGRIIMGPLSRPRSKILRVAVSRIILSSEASKVKLVGNLVA